MSRINDYIIDEEESGKREVVDSPEPQIPPPVEITIDSGVPIPKDLIDRSDLNNRFGKLPFHIMTEGQSFALDNLSDKEFVALRARVSRANKTPKADSHSSKKTKQSTAFVGVYIGWNDANQRSKSTRTSFQGAQ